MPALLQILEKILSTLNMYNRHLFRFGLEECDGAYYWEECRWGVRICMYLNTEKSFKQWQKADRNQQLQLHLTTSHHFEPVNSGEN